MKNKELIKAAAKKHFGSFSEYAKRFDTNGSNFTKRIESYINKLNMWLEPLGYKIVIEPKK